MMSLQSSSQDSSQEDDKARKEDRPSSYHLPKSCGDNPDEDKPSEDFSKPRTLRYHSKWKSRQDAWAQKKDYSSGKPDPMP